jgi:hypothetical protein
LLPTHVLKYLDVQYQQNVVANNPNYYSSLY